MCVELSITARAKQLRKYRSHLKTQQNRISTRKQFNANIILIKFTLRSHYDSISIPWNGYTRHISSTVYTGACVRLAHIKYGYIAYVYLTFYQLHRLHRRRFRLPKHFAVEIFVVPALRWCVNSARRHSLSHRFTLEGQLACTSSVGARRKSGAVMQNLINFGFCWLSFLLLSSQFIIYIQI